ncbi:Protein of unknown function DUF1367 [uncultured Caudovirales phage]|uniref:Uncharacterized protein n=1 Tax=uncultured Caudovirales phage TaxID=2100421 RepID=A0A6J7WQP2_9CAUD|nr:Protein of unknown function DUF1367 [uncultured Caudovirales phage]
MSGQIAIIVRRSGDKLVPVTEWDRDRLLDVPEGKDLSIRISRTRSARQHRLFWALMQIVVDNHPFYMRGEQLVEWLKVRLGYVDEIMFHDGSMMTKVSSISFTSMGQDEFQKFFNLALHVIITEVVPVSREQLLDQLEAVMGEKVESWVQR